ncbi:MAG: AAA family ATPase [Spirochaetaceae bacterium]|jgi:superfamily I DNA and/or RNA helicase|nr:AAA family ATPase [Spirochaetaceae bacterium]
MAAEYTETSYKSSRIIVKGQDKTDKIKTYIKNGNKIDIIFSDTPDTTYSYSAKDVTIIHSSLADKRSRNCFEYLKEIASVVGLIIDGKNILANRYAEIDFIETQSIFASFLTGKPAINKQAASIRDVYPFGFNASQRDAVKKALSSSLSIIEGPPGTGKTQTILNIIASALMNGESVAVVSSNNSATANVFEKLEKYGLDFIAAKLGNTQNKEEFLQSQRPLPDVSKWELSTEQESKMRLSMLSIFDKLNEMLAKKEKLAKLRQELDGIEIEHRHFKLYRNVGMTETLHKSWQKIDAKTALDLWLFFERYAAMNKLLKLIHRIINRIKYGVTGRQFFKSSPDIIIALCQNRYYETSINEYNLSIKKLETELSAYNFNEEMQKYSELSMQIFRNELSKKYANSKRDMYSPDDLWKKSAAFIKDYPVILSTTYSLRSSLSKRVMYDYVVIDEASQVDIATGGLALSCAKKAVIVGDLKQLPNVVDAENRKRTDAVFDKYELPEMYRYSNHSLLLSLIEMFSDAPKTLLREHYRCHPKIIGFCNQKFYGGQLVILSEIKSNRQPLMIYKTVPGNHARYHVNKRQIDVIKNEIIPQQGYDPETSSLGIVTPYRNQTNELQKAFEGTGIKADTVDKFQGRENDVIILSTVDNVISDFTDNANRLNVAVSRAIQQLILVVNDNDDLRDTNIGDLIHYIKYNNGEIIKSEIHSIFDFLYKGYGEQRKELLKRYKKISEFDSENLMYAVIMKILKEEQFLKYGVSVHVPLRMIIRDSNKLDNEEKQYAMNILTHVDFLIFYKIGRIPALVVEVDGAEYHKEGARQAERDKLKNSILEKYGLPVIRCITDESLEEKRLKEKLDQLSGYLQLLK